MSEFSDQFDISQQEGAQAPSDLLARLKEAAEELLATELAIETMEEDLKQMKKTLQFLRTNKVPELMGEAGMSSTTINNRTIELTEFVSGTIPKDPVKRAVALALLKSYGAEGLLKTEVSLEFGKSQYEDAERIFKELVGNGYAPWMDTSVHPQTLAKFARDRLKAGKEIDFESLGLYSGKIAKVKDK